MRCEALIEQPRKHKSLVNVMFKIQTYVHIIIPAMQNYMRVAVKTEREQRQMNII